MKQDQALNSGLPICTLLSHSLYFSIHTLHLSSPLNLFRLHLFFILVFMIDVVPPADPQLSFFSPESMLQLSSAQPSFHPTLIHQIEDLPY